LVTGFCIVEDCATKRVIKWNIEDAKGKWQE